MFKYAIFDVDGTLLDTEPLYTIAIEKILSRFGSTFTNEVKCKCMGLPSIEACKLIVSSCNVPMTAEEFLEEREEHLSKLWPTCNAMPGAEELVRTIKAKGVKCGIATSAAKKYFDLKITNHEFFSLFDAITCGDDPAVKRGKPNPDIFLETANKLGCCEHKAIVFEDSVTGVEAAKRAEMFAVAIVDLRYSNVADYKNADYVITSYSQSLLNEWF